MCALAIWLLPMILTPSVSLLHALSAQGRTSFCWHPGAYLSLGQSIHMACHIGPHVRQEPSLQVGMKVIGRRESGPQKKTEGIPSAGTEERRP